MVSWPVLTRRARGHRRQKNFAGNTPPSTSLHGLSKSRVQSLESKIRKYGDHQDEQILELQEATRPDLKKTASALQHVGGQQALGN